MSLENVEKILEERLEAIWINDTLIAESTVANLDFEIVALTRLLTLGSSVSHDIEQGQTIKLTGFSNSANNRNHYVSNVNGNILTLTSTDLVDEVVESVATISDFITPIKWDATRRRPLIGVSFIRCQVDGIGSRNLSLSCRREDYLFTIQVLVASEEGSRGCAILSDTIENGFKNYAEGYLLCKESFSQRVGDEKEWHQRNVTINVQYDQHS